MARSKPVLDGAESREFLWRKLVARQNDFQFLYHAIGMVAEQLSICPET